jgi:hypothetical protein
VSGARSAALGVFAILAACRGEARPPGRTNVEPPVSSPGAIPDARVTGTIRGLPFAARDARYIVDRRVGYAHTDIRLSAGTTGAPCGPIDPPRAASVWLRLDGADPVGGVDLRLKPGDPAPWSIHYQSFDGERWVGVGEGSAIVSIQPPSPDGTIRGGLAVCFTDDPKSCVSGSFEATSCPQRIDEPVRGAVAPEAMKEKR